MFFNDTATTEIYTLSLHDALPIYARNCLLRNGLAIEATPAAMNAKKTQDEAKAHHAQVELERGIYLVNPGAVCDRYGVAYADIRVAENGGVRVSLCKWE